MKVLMISRSTLYTSPGGDTVQLEKTAKYLRLLGIEVQIELADKKVIDYSVYDLIHFFNIIRPDDILSHLNHSKPVCISTIFVDFSEYDKMARQGFTGFLLRLINDWEIEYIKSIARYFLKGDKIKSRYYLFRGQRASVLMASKRAKLLLPNSHSEYNRLSSSLKKNFPYKKVTNAIDHQLFKLEVEENIKFKDHVICVGRIEGRKNQLNVIKAMIGSEKILTLIGKPAPNQPEYYKECLELASLHDNINIIEQIDHQELASVYKAAKVHILASWFETTGLSSLEAAVMGCNVVITKKGDTEEYFGSMGFYCEPDNVESIKEAINRAYDTPFDTKLRDYILNDCTWEVAARQTLEAYGDVLETNIG